MSKAVRRNTGICKECKRDRKIHAKGFCLQCYHNDWNKSWIAGLTEEAREEFKRKRKEYCVRYRKGKGRFIESKHKALKDGLEWNLDRDTYENLIKQECYSCQFLIESGGRGLDRIDNSKGYSIDNVLPCCYVCNCARNDNFTVEEMKNEIGPAIRRIKLKQKELLNG
jgi:hypothetical protein